MSAQFYNIETRKGYSIVKDNELSTPEKAIYEFRLNHVCPLTFEDWRGVMYRPDQHFFTDQGSIPKVIQAFLPKDRFLGFYLHDSAYKHGGLWLKAPGEKYFKFHKMTKDRVDELLHEMCLADPVKCWTITADIVYAGVCMGSPFVEYGQGDDVFRNANKEKR